MIQKQIAERNIKLHTWINFLAGVAFLAPVMGALKYAIGLTIMEIVIIYNIGTIVVWLFELPTSVLADTMGRKKSLLAAVVCNLFAAVSIFVYPSYIGFIIASFFGGLYYAFWSGTGQAFLDENLKVLGRQKEFGKIIGNFLSAEKIGSLITPLIASLVIYYSKFFNDGIIGYRILGFFDVIMALVLVVMVYKLVDTTIIEEKIIGMKNILRVNYDTAKDGLKNVFHNDKLRLILIYKSLSNSCAYFYVIFMPFVLKIGMPDWYSGIIMTIATIGAMLASKYAHKISDKKGYNFAWVFASVLQGIILVVAGFLLQNWLYVVIIYVVFDIVEHLWYPAWNHIVVEHSQGKAVATTRSIIFGIFALYTTLGKQFLAIFPIEYALIGSGIFIILVNIVLGKKILALKANN